MALALEGRTAIVAGAGSGVGRAVARRFAGAGARLMLADTDEAGLEETVSGIDAPADRLARFGHGIDDRLGVTNLVAAAADAFGRIDVLVTGMRAGAPGGVFEIVPEEFDAAVAGHVGSVFLQCQLVARRMVQQREEDPEFRGALVNISSVAARRTVPGLLAFSVACAALDQLTRSLAVCLAPEQIRVNAVALGGVMTAPLLEALRGREELRGEVVAATPLGRLGEIEEAAEAVVFLASPAASFITGQVLGVDGGRLVLDPLASPER